MRRQLLMILCCVVGWFLAEFAIGQERPIHYFHNAMLPPGTVGQGQLLRFPALRHYFQPVQVVVPDGVQVSLLVDGQFDGPQPGPRTAGMLVGSVYQLKITNIPFHEGFEVYPTIEVLNRLYPPHGKQTEFPVPVEFTQAEMELALSGRFVTRVIYLEDPDAALAFADEPGYQRYFDVAPDQDPLRAADRLGRPMAIMRMGSRVPSADSGETPLLHESPPVLLYAPEQLEPATTAPQAAIERHGPPIPRIPLPGTPADQLAPAGWTRP